MAAAEGRQVYLYLCERVVDHLDAFLYLGNQWPNSPAAKKEVSQLGMMLSMHPALGGPSGPAERQEFLASWAASAMKVPLQEGDLLIRDLVADLIGWSMGEPVSSQRLKQMRGTLEKLRQDARPARKNRFLRLVRRA